MSRMMFHRQAHRHPVQVLPLLALLLIVSAMVVSVVRADWGANLYGRWIKPAFQRAAGTVAVSDLDRDAMTFQAQTAIIANTSDCFPLHMRDISRVGVLYLYCPPEAYDKDGETVAISENFSIPDSIARRVNFWRRIYSLWGKDQYVMHSSHYPEVIIGAFDASRLGDEVGPVMREIQVKRVAKRQRDLYRTLLTRMHQLRNTPDRFTPAMQRIARGMEHIADRDKYLTVARTLRLQRGQRDFVASGLANAPRYLPAIEKEFVLQGIPVEITRLAFVESSFNVAAHSKVGASGVYQIMPETGRQYLIMHSGIDERRDPIKAGRAAAKLLRLNFGLTGSWPLAITAYNHGVGGIRRAVRATGSDDIAVLINRYDGPQFGFASKNFYSSFLGMLATLKEADRIFPEVIRPQPMAFESVRLPRPTSISQIRRQHKMTLMEVAEYNPDISRPLLRSQGMLPRGYVIKVPTRTEDGMMNVNMVRPST